MARRNPAAPTAGGREPGGPEPSRREADGQARGRPGAGQTARERARAQLTRDIKDEARRQLAAEGAQRLSLRAVARSLGMVSSALYRYFPSRDDLLTALIIDAYDALGASAERAAAAGQRGDIRSRWRACCHAVRDWAIAHPHEYALIYGSPVPGYQAPAETVGHATRVALVMGGLITEAWRQADPAADRVARRQRLPGRLAGQAETVAAVLASAAPAPATLAPGTPAASTLAAGASAAAAAGRGVPPSVIARALIAWTQLFGMVSFELFGQLVGSADPSDDFFGYAVEQMADLLGLPA